MSRTKRVVAAAACGAGALAATVVMSTPAFAANPTHADITCLGYGADVGTFTSSTSGGAKRITITTSMDAPEDIPANSVTSELVTTNGTFTGTVNPAMDLGDDIVLGPLVGPSGITATNLAAKTGTPSSSNYTLKLTANLVTVYCIATEDFDEGNLTW